MGKFRRNPERTWTKTVRTVKRKQPTKPSRKPKVRTARKSRKEIRRIMSTEPTQPTEPTHNMPPLVELEARIRSTIQAEVQPRIHGWVDEIIDELVKREMTNVVTRLQESLQVNFAGFAGAPPTANANAPRGKGRDAPTKRRVLDYLMNQGEQGATANDIAPRVYPDTPLDLAIKMVSSLLNRSKEVERVPNSGRPQHWRIANRHG